MSQVNKTYTIKEVVKNGKKYYLRFEEIDEDYLVNEDQIVSYRLIKGNVLDQKTYKTLMTDVNNTVYYNKALHFIDFKPRTKKEINEYLTKFQLDESTINKIIKKLEKIGFIDDERYANRYTEELIRKGKGKKAIYNLLIKKGIEQDLINENLSKYEKDDEFANALRIAEKLVKPESDYPIKKQKMQLIEKLLREGYGQDAINYAMSNITFTDNSQERLIKEYEKLQDKNIEKEKIIGLLFQLLEADAPASVLCGLCALMDDEVRRPHGVLIMLHHHQGVPALFEPVHGGNQTGRIAGMKSNGRFIQNKERIRQGSAQTGGQAHAFNFPSGQGPRGAVGRQVAQSHFIQIFQAAPEFRHGMFQAGVFIRPRRHIPIHPGQQFIHGFNMVFP
mgnify:CR=1 FL=1